MARKKKKLQVTLDDLSMAVKLARENGMTYAQLQVLESNDKARIRNGKLLLKGRDY